MNNHSIYSQQTMYQADPAFIQSLSRTQQQLFDVGSQCSNRPVRIQMMNGQIHEGTIAHMDDGHLYLRVSNQDARGFFNPWTPSPVNNDIILPLVLYNLLVISLL
ncbi:hypothetical protein GCM10008018_36130 [Paenibacillus marchantiophytorum]|uniref:Acetyl-CoA acetyltransferase n=1 Tax=Paenibacillus marchantiophytorum TaxID=1619310 RepID=A0ABQ1EUT2_9BACL|nr:acetyl-CoA acetyltransferase [Paenibacillus marchantiophytorum]GFZ86853.1 hypothetical protein GCM10008018_36130 [Paenibacillus marchantiophytorum]